MIEEHQVFYMASIASLENIMICYLKIGMAINPAPTGPLPEWGKKLGGEGRPAPNPPREEKNKKK